MSVTPGTMAPNLDAFPPVLPYGPSQQGSVVPPKGDFGQGDQAAVSVGQSSGGATDADTMKKLLMAVITHAQQNKQLAQPVPAPIPHPNPSSPGPIYRGSGASNIIPIIGNMIQFGVTHHKQNELAKAESAWNQFGAIVDSGDQNKAQLWVASHEKDLKGMAKALNQDWLNPEKTTVYKQALDSYLQKKQAKDQAATGLKAKFQELIGKAFGKSDSKNVMQNLTPDQQAAMSKEIVDKAPVGTPPMDPLKQMQGQADVMKAFADMTRASTEAKDKYAVTVTADGKVLAYDKGDPKNHFFLKDEDGNNISGQTKGSSTTGKVAMVGQTPYGITGIRDGKNVVKTPGDPDWTGEDSKTFAAATAASAQSMANADHRNIVSANARAKAYAATREYGVIDSETGGLAMISPDVINQNPGRYAPASQAIQTKNRSAIFDEIDYTAGQLNEAINQLPDDGFDAKSRAQISAVLRDTDPRSALSTFLGSEAASTLSDPQINYITGLVSMQESAMSLRSVAGMGQGSDTMRNAIIRMLPGTGTPSKKYAQRQMQLLKGETDQLRKSIPKLGDQSKPQGGGGGTGVIVVSPDDMK